MVTAPSSIWLAPASGRPLVVGGSTFFVPYVCRPMTGTSAVSRSPAGVRLSCPKPSSDQPSTPGCLATSFVTAPGGQLPQPPEDWSISCQFQP